MSGVTLGMDYRALDGSHWHLQSEHWRTILQEVSHGLDEPAAVSPSRVLAQRSKRFVFWHPAPQARSGKVVVKGLYPRRWVWVRDGSDSAQGEAENLLCAAERGLAVPALVGFGQKRRFGRIVWSACLTEFVPFPSMREPFLRGVEPEAKMPLLRRALPLLTKLYDTGSNHVDFGPHAILLSHEPGQDYIIDWEFATFSTAPDLSVLGAQAGYFAWSVSTNRDWVSRQMIQDWFDELLCISRVPESEYARLRSIFEQHRSARAPLAARMARGKNT